MKGGQQKTKADAQTWRQAFKKALFSFLSITPMILGVIGLVALMQTFVTPQTYTFLFGHGDWLDTLAGTFIGGISVGQGMISYVIAEGLLREGVSLYALSAFILSWVTLGIVQLPAEAAVFGIRFTFYRNLLALIFTVMVAYLTVLTLELFA